MYRQPNMLYTLNSCAFVSVCCTVFCERVSSLERMRINLLWILWHQDLHPRTTARSAVETHTRMHSTFKWWRSLVYNMLLHIDFRLVRAEAGSLRRAGRRLRNLSVRSCEPSAKRVCVCCSCDAVRLKLTLPSRVERMRGRQRK